MCFILKNIHRDESGNCTADLQPVGNEEPIHVQLFCNDGLRTAHEIAGTRAWTIDFAGTDKPQITDWKEEDVVLLGHSI